MLRNLMVTGAALLGALTLGVGTATPGQACSGGECSETYCACERECSQQFDRFSPEWQGCVQNCPDQPPIACVCPEF